MESMKESRKRVSGRFNGKYDSFVEPIGVGGEPLEEDLGSVHR